MTIVNYLVLPERQNDYAELFFCESDVNILSGDFNRSKIMYSLELTWPVNKPQAGLIYFRKKSISQRSLLLLPDRNGWVFQI